MSLVCSCPYRKKIEITITDIKEESVCGVSDLALVDILDFDLKGPNGEPVLRIRFCPWCGSQVPKPERITHQKAEEDVEELEEWQDNEDE